MRKNIALCARCTLAAFVAASVLIWPPLADGPDSLPIAARGVVEDVVDGAVVHLQGIAADVRLVSVQAPKLSKGRAGFRIWPLADEARDALAVLVHGRAVVFRSSATPRDRNGRVLAHLVCDDRLWVQHELLRLGWARVYTFADNRRFAAELYAAERAARSARRGIWNDPFCALRKADPRPLAKDIGTFQIVEGRVLDAAKVRGRIYLNFGEDHRSNFTATIPPDAVSTFTRAKFDPLTLEGKVNRVRGYLRSCNGPVIDLTHPEQNGMDSASQ